MTLLGVSMVLAGALHFIMPAMYLPMMPPWLPAPLALIYASGVFEILGGAGLFVPSLRRLAAFGLIALFIAIFPANLHMALNHVSIGQTTTPAWVLWARLPLQAVLIAWAAWFTR